MLQDQNHCVTFLGLVGDWLLSCWLLTGSGLPLRDEPVLQGRSLTLPVLGRRELHTQKTKFKLACLVRLSLFRQAPLYLADDCCLVSDSTRRSLWSADVQTCMVLQTLSSYGDRTFTAAGTRLWNSRPVQLRNLDITHGLFRRQLKRHLFREAWTRRSVTSDMLRLRKTFTYLLTLMLLIEWQEEHLDCKNLPKTYRQTFSSRTSNWRKLRGTS